MVLNKILKNYITLNIISIADRNRVPLKFKILQNLLFNTLFILLG